MDHFHPFSIAMVNSERVFQIRMAEFTARGPARAVLSVTRAAPVLRPYRRAASSRMAVKHEKSDASTTMRASIVHEEGLKTSKL